MTRGIQFAIPENGLSTMDKQATVDRFPDKCPLCNVTLDPKFVYAAYYENANSEIIFRCTNNNCGSHFISYYVPINIIQWTYARSAPHNVVVPIFEDEINEISPSFSEIHGQAYRAQAMGLNHIAGMGYRKALEFLIKDYLINFLEKDRENIEKKLLGKCIKDDVTNDNIKLVAERAVWIGNDETHYVRKWETKDINDLKKLISVTVHWISSEIITKRVVDEMQ